MQFHFEFPTLVERLGENMSKHAHEKHFFQKKISKMGWDLNPGLWFHSLILYQLSHWECWWCERFFVYLKPFWNAFALLKECMHCSQLCTFFEFLTVGYERLRDFQIEKHAFEDVNRKKKSGESGVWTQVCRFTIQHSTNWAIRHKVKRSRREGHDINMGSTIIEQRVNVKEVVNENKQSVPLALSASPMGLLRRSIKDWQ